MGSYFGSELCPVDIDMDGTTDFLLVAAPFFHVHGQEGRVYMYRVNEQVGESPSLQAGWGCGYSGWCRGDRGSEHPGPGSDEEVLRVDDGQRGSGSTPSHTPLSRVPHPMISY